MAKATKPQQPRIMIVATRTGADGVGQRNELPWSRTVPATESEPAYRKHFEPGVPTILNAREIAACAKDLECGRLVECNASPEALRETMEHLVDVERDGQIRHLRFLIGELVGALKGTGMFRQAEIDAILSGEVVA
ncbi:MAG TPA: hypothetical protein PKC18_18830, partial [Lacipirellulaceae bacterium]|nr:hypothetical protein [Lacipirellulaceae bacterium]